MVKRKCTKGYSCGASCIATSKACKKDFPLGVSISLEERRALIPEITYPPTFKDGSKKREALLARERQELVAKFGERVVRAAEERVEKVLRDAEVRVQVPDGATLEQILKSRFKTQFETKTTRGLSGLDRRTEVEETTLQIGRDVPAENRPVYGVLASPTDPVTTLGQYGSVRITLKNSVKERTSNTLDDSFSPSVGIAANTPPAGSFNIASYVTAKDQFAKEYLSELARARSTRDITLMFSSVYLEAQIHDQVKPSDIESITLPSAEATPFIRDWARENNVKLSVI